MNSRITLIILFAVVLSCSEPMPSTIDPPLQKVGANILAELFPTPVESAYCIALDREGRVFCWSSWQKPDGHLGTFDPYLLPPSELFLPIILASAIVDGVLPDSLFSPGDAMALDSRYLTALMASAYGSADRFEMHIKEWFPHAVVNAPQGEKDVYRQLSFRGGSAVIPAAEIAAFFNSIAHDGLLASPRVKADERSLPVERRIMPEHVANTLSRFLHRITACPGSSSNLTDLGFPVAGLSGSTRITMDDGGNGLLSSFVGTFELGGHGQVTLLVVLAFASDNDCSPETSAKSVFERISCRFKVGTADNYVPSQETGV